MRHEAALKRLDELDSRDDYGLALRWHLERCPSCSSVADRLARAIGTYREHSGDELFLEDCDRIEDRRDLRIEDRVMAAVRLLPPPRQDFALGDWLFPGIVLALSMVLLPLIGKDVDFLKSLFGSGYLLSLSLVMGAAFTAYCALVIATHLTEIQIYLEKRGLMPR